ncbi:MAG: hypothetical protein HQK49_19020 [Oligoflexia bacterium]|nr:hypothetical protein [Oligoflexia bacterium]
MKTFFFSLGYSVITLVISIFSYTILTTFAYSITISVSPNKSSLKDSNISITTSNKKDTVNTNTKTKTKTNESSQYRKRPNLYNNSTGIPDVNDPSLDFNSLEKLEDLPSNAEEIGNNEKEKENTNKDTN